MWVLRLLRWIGLFGNDLDKVAQAGHTLAGLLFPLLFYTYVPIPHAALWGSFLIVVVWAGPKEFYIDIKYEPDTWAGSFEDWWHYLLGAGVQLVLLQLLKGGL
jgi:hypothetical protein